MIRRPEWFWVTVWGKFDGVLVVYRYRGPVLGWNSGSATVRAGNRLRRRFPGIDIVATDTKRAGFLPYENRIK